MNLFKALYCNQYYELEPKGKGEEANMYGTRLLTIALVFNVISCFILLMLLSPDFLDWWDDLLKDLFGRRQSRVVGKLVALVPFVVVYPMVRFSLGTEANYSRLIERFKSLPAEDQKRISRKGLYYFLASTGLVIVCFILTLVFLT